MTYHIVVARYNENIDWTNQFKHVVVYNKGDKLSDNFKQVCLKNVGREGHTYYKYICDNYDNLKDYTIFLQGNPFDHSPNLIKRLNKYINKYIKKNKRLRMGFKFLSENILKSNLSGCPYHPNLPLVNIYEKLFNKRKEKHKFLFGAGAQFIVSKKNILKRPKEFYQKIVEMLENDINPVEGYVIERFHKIIFK
jgi:hypothetical protein